ncbi:hypothetical protein QC760_006509 [Botrytis cinerea]
MGIPGLWDFIADCKEIVDLAEFAAQHFELHKRPLRIAVDEATWRHKLCISNKAKLCKGTFCDHCYNHVVVESESDAEQSQNTPISISTNETSYLSFYGS